MESQRNSMVKCYVIRKGVVQSAVVSRKSVDLLSTITTKLKKSEACFAFDTITDLVSLETALEELKGLLPTYKNTFKQEVGK